MEIYVVQQGDTIKSIAERFGIGEERLIIDNGLEAPDQLVKGQTLVIAYPKQTHIVQQDDSLQSIADTYHITVMQLLRNNPYLSDREYIYPGELLVISYDTNRSITTTGFAFPFIAKEILLKTLPSLTYLSIFNYRISESIDIQAFQEDNEIIATSKDYGVVPILLLSILTLRGEPDIETAYKILLSEELQEKIIKEFIDIIKNKGYGGINIVFNLVNEENQSLFLSYIKRVSEHLKQENLLFFITINFKINDNSTPDYSQFSAYVNEIIFLQLKWGANFDPPAPVSNIESIKALINQELAKVPPEKIVVGKPTIGYDWTLPYIANRSIATSLNINATLDLAYTTNSTIQFDDTSQTPYFYYSQMNIGLPVNHIVWFIDARSLNALLELIKEDGLNGSGIWSIMIYYPQLWLLINSQFDVIKMI